MRPAYPDVGRFELRGELGSGGMGEVFRVFDRERGEEVALKSLRDASGRDLYRFKREFRSLADLAHPNLVSLFELFTTGNDWMFTMELVDGVPFHEHVRPGGPDGVLDEGKLRAALAQLVDGLCGLHAAGKIHRDVKPSNVLVDRAGRVVILDFGLVADVDALGVEGTHEESAVGTPAYMSPEQASDRPLTACSDWYSVGVMLYEVLTGRRPFEGPPTKVIVAKQKEDPPEVLTVTPHAPVDLALLSSRLLARDPEVRPDDAQVLAALGVEPSPWTRRITARVAKVAPVGREAELEALRQAFADSRAHLVSVAVLGPCGSGKSTLVEAFTAELRERHPDAVVLFGRISSREVVPFRGFDRLVDAVAGWLASLPREEAAALLPKEGLAALGRLFPTIRRVPAAKVPALFGNLPTDPADLQGKAFAALRALFIAIGARHPLVIIGDDMQWASPEGGAVISAFLAEPGAPKALVVFAHRSEDTDAPLLEVLPAWPGDLRTITLAALPAVLPK